MKPNQLQLQFWDELDAAESYCRDAAEFQKARNALMRIRLYPELGIVPRARCNLLLSQLFKENYPVPAAKYARECLDLLDIVRQKWPERGLSENSEQLVATMEDASKDVLDDIELKKNQVDEMDLDEGLETLRLDSPSKNNSGKRWIKASIPIGEAQLIENRKKNPPLVVEGFLRRSGKYKPMKEYVPLSREQLHDEPAAISAVSASTESSIPTTSSAVQDKYQGVLFRHSLATPEASSESGMVDENLF